MGTTKNLYSLFDTVAKEYAAPWLDNNDAAAARRFKAWISQNSSQPNFKSTDYALFKVGDFDVASAEIVPAYKEIAINEGEDE